MDASTAVWLVLTLAAPVTLVPKIALMRLLHSRRAAWHPLDVLIVSLLAAQLCCVLLTLGMSTAALIRQAGLWPSVFLLGSRTPLCAALICGWAAAHTLHAATLTSLAVDGAMTARWSYKYRLSVRRTQLRYHVVVLAVISLMVGVAALFASSGATGHGADSVAIRPGPALQETLDRGGADATDADQWINSTNASLLLQVDYWHSPSVRDGCTFLPHLFDSRFSLFWLCLHGVLFIATLSAAAVTLATRLCVRCGAASARLGSGSDMRTLGNASEGSSATLPLPLAPPPPPPRYTPAPVAALRSFAAGRHFGADEPLARSNQNLFASADKTYVNLLHHEPTAADYATPIQLAYNRQRHSTVAAVLILAYLTYHLPLLVSRWLCNVAFFNGYFD